MSSTGIQVARCVLLKKKKKHIYIYYTPDDFCSQFCSSKLSPQSS